MTLPLGWENYLEIQDAKTQISNNESILGEYFITPQDNPQTIIDNAPAGSKITFTGGVHVHSLTRNNAMISIEKPLHLHIPKTATLKVADSSMTVNKNAELITNFHANNPITGLLINNTGYTQGENVRTYEIQIDSTGTPNTFKYQIRDFDNNIVTNWIGGIAISGNYQTLADGITIKFPQTTGYTSGAGCIVAVGSIGYYVIRVGTGTHSSYIDGVEITGEGVIDQNQDNNAYSNLYALNLNCGLFINGRVKNFKSHDKIRFKNCNRIMVVLGENIGGTFNLDGTVTGGTSYDVDTVSIKNIVKDTGNISGVLFGMPEHRGYINNLTFEDNEIECNLTAIEPNNLLQNYSIKNNKLYTNNYAIHCWRYSKNGVIEGNICYLDCIGDVLLISTPSGWKVAENINHKNNIKISSINGLSNVLSGGLNNTITGSYNVLNGGTTNTITNDKSVIGGGTNNTISSLLSAIIGGLQNVINNAYGVICGGANNTVSADKGIIVGGTGNIVSGQYACVPYGQNNQATTSFSSVKGMDGKSLFANDNVLASGKISTVGDTQILEVCVKAVSTGSTFVELKTNTYSLNIPQGYALGYTTQIIGRQVGGARHGIWKAEGLIVRNDGGNVQLVGNSVTKLYATDATWDCTVEAYVPTQILNIKAHGDTGQTVNWVAHIKFTQLYC